MQLTAALAACSSLVGCLLSPPADYEDEQRIPPRLEVLTAEPVPYTFHVFHPGDSVDFKVWVESNDVSADGESRLLAVLIRNFDGYADGELDVQKFRFIPAARLDDGPREVSVSYTFDETDGCYQYTLFVTHSDNGNPPEEVARPEDVAIVTWWVIVDSDDELDYSGCLTEGQQ